ncbi:hypothetical protein V7S43_013816 [Phytophthora oleae]|uniref:Uncharacterized protein n=1 Tax=Phytophthora oleae TaxID=2107226 RepID=A0ABD3F6T2_9STRA
MENSAVVTDVKVEKSLEVIKVAPVGVAGRFVLRCRHFWTGVTVIPTFVVVLLGLLMFGFIVESRIISCIPEVAVLNETAVCRPRVLNASNIQYHSGHRYYDQLKEMEPIPPTFRNNNHTVLCHEELRTQVKYGYCLPISGRKDVPYCTAADRTDLLNARSHDSICYASVLHMLMLEVYKELQATGNIPFLTFRSLLGAFRSDPMISFTEDADIGFVNELTD